MSRRRTVILSSRRWHVALPPAGEWQALRDALVRETYWPGIDLMADGSRTDGVSPDFDSIAKVVTAPAQMVATDGTVGLAGGKTYRDYRCEFFFDAPQLTGRIKLKNSWLAGPPTYNNPSPLGLLRAFNPGHAAVDLEDCTVIADNPLPQVNGLHGFNFTALRCRVGYVSDGFSTFRSWNDNPAGDVQVTIDQCSFDNLVWVSKAGCAALGITTPSDGMHNDIGQHQGGTGLILRGNSFRGLTAPEWFNTYYADPLGRSNGILTYQNNVGEKDGNGATIFGSGSVQYAVITGNRFEGGRSAVNYTSGAAGNPNYVGLLQRNLFVQNQATASILRKSSICSVDVGSAGPPDTRNYYVGGGLVPVSAG